MSVSGVSGTHYEGWGVGVAEVVLFIGYKGMCNSKGYGFLGLGKTLHLFRNRVLILAILVSNRVWFLHSCLELCLEEAFEECLDREFTWLSFLKSLFL